MMHMLHPTCQSCSHWATWGDINDRGDCVRMHNDGAHKTWGNPKTAIAIGGEYQDLVSVETAADFYCPMHSALMDPGKLAHTPEDAEVVDRS